LGAFFFLGKVVRQLLYALLGYILGDFCLNLSGHPVEKTRQQLKSGKITFLGLQRKFKNLKRINNEKKG
jgi:hypothetical protein